MRAFINAVERGHRQVVRPTTVSVELNKGVWLRITNYRNLEVLEDPSGFPHKRIDIQLGSKLNKACNAFVQKSNEAAVADILGDIGF